MEIQKEREAFETELKKSKWVAGNISTFWDALADEYQIPDVQIAWHMWQAAKAQAVPEGFVVLTIDDVDRVLKCLDDDAVFITYKASEALESIRKTMIEAQEQKG